MSIVRSAVLYTALALCANAAAAEAPPDALRTGEMQTFVRTDAASAWPDIALIDETDAARSLSEFHGRVVLVNFWATWCAPCRIEMPQLQALQDAMGGPDFAVATVAVGRNPVAAIDRFFGEAGITSLPKLRDPKQELAAALGIFGLPVSILLDRDGNEIGRLTGEADWSSPEAKAMIAAAIGG